MIVCLVAAGATFLLAIVFMPALELLPAQVFPEKRESGESCVPGFPGATPLLHEYGKIGLQIVQQMPPAAVPMDEAAKAEAKKAWEEKLVTTNGDKYAPIVKKNIEEQLGEQNLQSLLDLLHVDKNYVYNAYGLFLGLSLLCGAIAIQAMGRWGAEEKTIIPVKK